VSSAAPSTRPPREEPSRGLLLTLVALLVLAAVSFGLRFANLGGMSYVVALGIAAIKAVLVAVFFMEILAEKVTARLAFATCITLFALLLAFVLADVVTRSRPPLDHPAGTAPRFRG
jgi:cytochrome c oxidase subunit IV